MEGMIVMSQTGRKLTEEELAQIRENKAKAECKLDELRMKESCGQSLSKPEKVLKAINQLVVSAARTLERKNR